MQKRLFLVFNHQFTDAQRDNARQALEISDVVEMPSEIRGVWGDIPPESERIRTFLEPVRNWLSENARKGDFVLIQGDFGACYLMVGFAFESGMVPVYSSTKRIVKEEHMPDGTVRMSHQFKHVAFRRYGM